MWSLCPFGELRDPLWRAAVQLSDLSDAGLISGVAETYSAGVCEAIMSLRRQQAIRRAELQKEALDEARRQAGL